MIKEKKREKARAARERFLCDIAAAVCVVATGLFLSLCALDAEKYENEESVSVAITFEEPERPRDKGFWELFCEGVASLLSGGA